MKNIKPLKEYIQELRSSLSNPVDFDHIPLFEKLSLAIQIQRNDILKAGLDDESKAIAARLEQEARADLWLEEMQKVEDKKRGNR